MNVQVTVVVPTYRRPATLQRCLAALAVQDLDARAYEIIVADDGPDDQTRQVVERFSRESPVRVCYLPVTATQGPAGARNAGWRSASAPILAFTDDDCVPEPCWLREGLAAMTPGADAAAGRIVIPIPSPPTDYERDAARLAEAEFVTANCFCRRQALEEIGGFDERFTAAWREDSDLHFSLLEGGYRIVRAPRAAIVHPVRPAAWGVSLRQQRKGFFNPLLYKKHPKLYRQRIMPLPRHYYAVALAAAMALAGAVLMQPLLAGLGAAIWIALSGWFAAYRLRGTSRAPSHVAEMAFTSALIPLVSLYWHFRGAVKHRVLFV